MFDYIPGVQFLRELYIEQTTPIETIAFILVTVVLCMIFAVLLYVAVMSLIWAVRLRSEVKFHRVFLPSAEQFKEYAGEYLLAISTSIILTLTMAAKHQTVEYFKSTLNTPKLASASDCEQYDVAHVFPVHACPENLAGVSVLNLLQLAASHGQSDHVEFFLQRWYRMEESQGTLPPHWVTEDRLIIACFVLIISYLLWLARHRSHYLIRNPEGGEGPEYSQTARPLLALAVCVALLLAAAPRVLPNANTVAQSTRASFEHLEPVPEAQAKAIEDAFERQQKNLSLLEGNPSEGREESIFAMITGVRQRVEGVERELRDEARETDADVLSLETRQQQDMQRLSGFESKLSTVEGRVGAQASQIDQIFGDVEMTSTGLGQAQSGIESLKMAFARFSNDLGGRIGGFQRTLASLSDRVNEAEREARAAQQAQSVLNDRLNNLNQSVNQLRNLQGQLNSLSDGLRGLANRLNEEVGRSLSTDTALANRLTAIENQIRTLEQNLNACCKQLQQPVIR